MNNKSFDGNPLTASLHGFSEYNTLDTSTPEQVKNITPADIQIALQQLQEKLKNHDIAEAVLLFYKHAKCNHNPHGTELHDFIQQVGDALYAEYKKRGGTGSRDGYLRALFDTLHIASLDEMKNSKDARAVISILGARRFIDQHEIDPEAHMELFESIMPGDPVTAIPDYALYAEFGLSQYRNVAVGDSKVPYSYVGKDLLLHYCSDSKEIPMDWAYGKPLIPLFGRRTNYVKDSTNFNIAPWWYSNTTVIPDAEKAPDGTLTATAVLTVKDIIPVEHHLIYQKLNVEMDETKVFSLFAKPEACRYLMISYKDMMASSIEVRAIFDLLDQRCFIMNPLDRYAIDMQKLNNGWSRCCLQLAHPIGQISDLKVTFFKAVDRNENPLMFMATEEIMGYVWGVQLEKGVGVSPYIPTKGEISTREPVYLAIPLSKELQSHGELTLDINYTNPGKYLQEIDKPIMSMWDGDKLRMVASHHNTGYTEVLHYMTLQVEDLKAETVTYAEMMMPTKGAFNQLVHGFKGTSCITAVNSFVRENTRLNTDMGTKILLGTDGTSYLDGYLDAFISYPVMVTPRQTQFLNGDIYE